MAYNLLPTAKVLHDFFRYDPSTGKLFFRERDAIDFEPKATGQGAKSAEACARGWNKRFAGREVATKLSSGYIYTTVWGKKVLAHRVIWKMLHGIEPDEVDHINGDPSDNRIENLRNVSHKENGRNMRLKKNNTSGATGINWFEPTRTWHVRITVDGQTIHLGVFKDLDEAARVRRDAEMAYGFHENHGRR